MAKVIIPTPLRKFTDNLSSIEATGNTVKEAILDIASNFPDVKKHLLESDGSLRGYIRIYVGDEDIKALNNEDTGIEDNSVLSIVPAIAGGIQ